MKPRMHKHGENLRENIEPLDSLLEIARGRIADLCRHTLRIGNDSPLLENYIALYDQIQKIPGCLAKIGRRSQELELNTSTYTYEYTESRNFLGT